MHSIAESSSATAHHVHPNHSHGHHHHHAGQANSTTTLTPPLVHWHVWLVGFEWTIPASQSPNNEPAGESARLVVEAVLSDFTPALSQGSDGAPAWRMAILPESRPTAVPPVQLWRDPWRTGPPVCDAARGLRSGVQLV